MHRTPRRYRTPSYPATPTDNVPERTRLGPPPPARPCPRAPIDAPSRTRRDSRASDSPRRSPQLHTATTPPARATRRPEPRVDLHLHVLPLRQRPELVTRILERAEVATPPQPGIVGAWCGCGSGSGANESNVPCRAVPRPSSRPRASRWTILRRAAGGTLGFVPQRCPPPRRRSMQCGQRRQASHAMARAVARGAPPAAGPSRPPLSLALPCLLCMPRRCLSRWLAGHLVSCYLYGSTAS